MKRLFLPILLSMTLFFSTGLISTEAAANISPSNQTIYGSSARAYWTLSWSGGSNPWIVNFDPQGDGSYININASTNFTSMNYSFPYNYNESAYKYWYPKLRVLDRNYSIIGTAQATVYQKLGG